MKTFLFFLLLVALASLFTDQWPTVAAGLGAIFLVLKYTPKEKTHHG